VQFCKDFNFLPGKRLSYIAGLQSVLQHNQMWRHWMEDPFGSMLVDCNLLHFGPISWQVLRACNAVGIEQGN
jgi:hypothetical protein